MSPPLPYENQDNCYKHNLPEGYTPIGVTHIELPHGVDDFDPDTPNEFFTVEVNGKKRNFTIDYRDGTAGVYIEGGFYEIDVSHINEAALSLSAGYLAEA